MSHPPIRVRFAPSPTGFMHIGNARTALINYLFAQQKGGTFIVRIEDTDAARNFDPGAKNIIDDLDWLSLSYNEGPGKGGPYAPYFQSERQHLYQKKLDHLIKKELIYRCFCTADELERKRERQRALKLPPRYDRTCLALSAQEIENRLAQNIPFIWRFKLDHSTPITITDLARGTIQFNLKHFSDFPLTRADGSFTFMFANFVDDLLMNITHIFRGEDHLSNTAGQAALYRAFDAPLPFYWHMPILVNTDNKKLSKRDFGFSLQDLKDAGFLPVAINNYLAVIGSSHASEIMDMKELASTFNFANPSTASKIKYDVDKLRWINHQWINRLAPHDLLAAVLPFLIKVYPQAASHDEKKLEEIVQIIKTDIYTLADTPDVLTFYFEKPLISKSSFQACISAENIKKISSLLKKNLAQLEDRDAFLAAMKKSAKEENIPLKELFWFMRLSLMEAINGPSIHDLIQILETPESKKRLEHAIDLCA